MLTSALALLLHAEVCDAPAARDVQEVNCSRRWALSVMCCPGYPGCTPNRMHEICDTGGSVSGTVQIGRYSGRELPSNIAFVVFLLSWIATRLVMFPGVVIRSVLYDTAVRRPALERRQAPTPLL